MKDDKEANQLYRFFRWFQLHGEKYVNLSIEKMIEIYLKEKHEKQM
jgi:hypothetical protein